MFTHLALNKKTMMAALMCSTFIGAVYAKAPVILNNAALTDSYIKAGNHISEVRTDANDPEIVIEGELDKTGHASHGEAIQQSLTLDSNNVAYSAYVSVDDNK
jgi:hypothetical protein